MLDYKLFLSYEFPSLDCSLLQSGWHACAPAHQYGPTSRDYYIIHYVKKGKGVLIKNDTHYQIKPGQGFLICPGEITLYRADKDDPWEYVWVGFKGSNCQKYMNLCHLNENNPVFSYNVNGDKPDLLEQYIRAINELDKTSIKYSFFALGYLYLFFGELMSNSTNETHKQKSMSLIFKALEYIESHYADSFSIADLAGYLFIDRVYLFRLFEKYLQKNPTQYIVDYRLSKACQLLTYTNFKIPIVAQLAGFNDLSHFGRSFKAKYDTTPAKYRKSPPHEVAKKNPVQTFDVLTQIRTNVDD